MSADNKVPVIGFAAWSGAGKTTLLRQLIPILRNQGLCIGVIKHAHHTFDIDKPGKDSYELRHAGAEQTLVASANRWALVMENEEPSEPVLQDMLAKLDQDKLDLILVEGFRHEVFPKIEICRPSTGGSFLYPGDNSIIAIASDEIPDVEGGIPVLDLNWPLEIARFICDYFGLEWLDQ